MRDGVIMKLKSKIMKALIVICNLLIISIASGCGYRFNATGLPTHNTFKSIAIPVVESESSSMGTESDFTSVLREEFINYSKLKILPRDRADVIIICRIYEIKEEPVAYRLSEYYVKGREITHEVTRSKRMNLTMDVKAKERETGKIIWHEESMKDTALFLMDDDPLVTRYNRRLALKEIAERMAKRIYLKTMERF